MIKITNVSKTYGKGKQKYHLFVNGVGDKKAINLTFEHNYEDGLAGCLIKCAEAVIKKELS